MAKRYTFTYLNKPAGQQIPAATLFFAANDTDAQAVWDGLADYLSADQLKHSNVALASAPTGVPTPPYKEVRVIMSLSDGTVQTLHIPHVQNALGEADILALIMGTAGPSSGLLWEGSGSGVTATGIVKYEEVNRVLA